MRDRDLADSHLASHWPDMAEALDSLPDVFQEKLAAFQGPLPRTPRERVEQFAGILAEALKEANVAEAERRGPAAGSDPELVEGMRHIAEDQSNQRLALRAACVLKQLGLDHRSDQQLANDYGLTTRAAPHAIRRQIERTTGLRCRSSKSDLTRLRCQERTTGRKRERAPFLGEGAWQRVRSLALTLPLPA
jgi:hypothetical protein